MYVCDAHTYIFYCVYLRNDPVPVREDGYTSKNNFEKTGFEPFRSTFFFDRF